LRIASEQDIAADLASGGSVRIVGGGSKLGWGPQVDAERELSTAGLDRIVEHNAGDLTAVLEAGVPLAAAQEAFASEGQMLALDPPDRGATIGGVVASADSGPLRSRFGGPRDLVLGVRVALPDGSVVKSGGKVIKNVAGYDLGKLMAGAFGTLGVIVEVAVRLHPRPEETATAAAGSGTGARAATGSAGAASVSEAAGANGVSIAPFSSSRTVWIGLKSATDWFTPSTCFLISSSSASRMASLNWLWNSDAMRRTLAVMLPTVRRALGRSLGPMTISATAPITITSPQLMSNMA